MNWVDWILLGSFLFAAIRGYSRGLVVELGSLVALVAGVWAGIHMSERFVAAFGLDLGSKYLSMAVTFLLVLVGVHLLTRVLSTLVDMAQLGIPDRVAGFLFAVTRSALAWSVLMNLTAGYVKAEALQNGLRGSKLHGPVSSIAPAIIPAMKDSAWIQDTWREVRETVEGAAQGTGD